MRVIAGTARGRRLVAPAGPATRPTPDRVREATFNALRSLDLVVDANVLDLFAGSGAMGIEALSQGAAHATFVDSDRHARAAIEANLSALGMEHGATVRAVPADRYLAEAVASRRELDLAFVDPPYDFDDWEPLLGNLPAKVVVVESDRPVQAPPRWLEVRVKRYGRTHVAILRRLDTIA